MPRRHELQVRDRERLRRHLRHLGQDPQVHRLGNRLRPEQESAGRCVGHPEGRQRTGRLRRRRRTLLDHLHVEDQSGRARNRLPRHGEPPDRRDRFGQGTEGLAQGGRHTDRGRRGERHVHPQQEHLHRLGDDDQGRGPRLDLEHQHHDGAQRRDARHGGRGQQRPRLEPQRHSGNPHTRFELHRHVGRGEGLQQPADHPRRRRNQHGRAVRPRHVRNRAHRRPEGRAGLDRLRRPGGQRRNRHRTPAGDRQQTPPELQLRARASRT